MAEVILMPKLSDTMTEGVVAEWHVKVGEEVSSGDLLAEIETDKATMEFESFYDGILLHIGVEKGATAPVNDVLAIIGEKGENVEEILANAGSSAPAAAPAEETKKEEKPAPAPAPAAETAAPKATPAPAPQAAPVASPNGDRILLLL